MKAAIIIRPLESLEEFRACQTVQKEAWAFPDLLIIPYTQLITVQHNGGVVLGAFDGSRLVGFVFGLLGRQPRGPLDLFSQRMGVRPDYQGRGIGAQLKWSQREWALAQNLDQIVWTYDPLEAPNARLNIAKLGGIVRRYERDIYGQHDTPLHAGLPTDRFVLEWALRSDRVQALRHSSGHSHAARPPDLRAWATDRAVNPVAGELHGYPVCGAPDLTQDAQSLLVEVPPDWQGLRRADMALARDWRAKTRAIFEHYLGLGYIVTGYVSAVEGGRRRNAYHLERMP